MTDWPTIVRDHGPTVWRVARRLLAHDADDADCFQQTFLAAVELDRREPVRHWPAALSWLATSRALDLLRKRVRRRTEPLAGEPTDHRPADDAGELAEALRVALAELEPTQAKVFCLVCLDGYGYADAAGLAKVLGDLTKNPVNPVGEDEIDGRKTKVYEVKGQKINGLPVTTKVWIDPKSGLPAKYETTIAGDGVNATSTYELFDWNKEFDAKLFDTDVPAGYKLRKTDPATPKK